MSPATASGRKVPLGWRGLLREFSPPILRRIFHGLFSPRWFRGTYPNWTEAAAASAGYDQPEILKKVLRATLEVKAGRAAFERDGVLFFEPECDASLMTALLHVAAAQRGSLRLIDFGGALGSTYFQHRGFLPALESLRWDVVEQAHYVAAGREHVEERDLRFYQTLAEVGEASPHDLLLASGVIHYLPDPYGFADELIAREYEWLVLNSLPLHSGADYATVQHVPPSIYRASYPMWFINRERFAARFHSDYELVWEFPGSAEWWMGFGSFRTRGWLLRRRKRVG